MYWDNVLSKSEVSVLSKLGRRSDQRIPLGEVAEQLDWGGSYASRVISDLAQRDFVRVEQEGRKKFVSVTGVQPVERMGDLASEFDHVDFPDLISGVALEILYYLDERRTASELVELSQTNRSTVYRRLDSLQNVGIVGKDHSHYQLTEPFAPLSDLARSIAHHDHRREALERTNDVTILWETHDEYLFSCASEVAADGFHRTGPAIFEDFGVPLLTRERLHHFRSKRLSRLTAADLVCHTMLIDDSTRYRIYCLLLIERQDVDKVELRDRGSHYTTEAAIDLVALTTDLTTYLETNGEATDETLPEWKEFKSTAADYDIAV